MKNKITSVGCTIPHNMTKHNPGVIVVWRSEPGSKNLHGKRYSYTPKRAYTLSRYADNSSFSFGAFDLSLWWGYD